MRLGGIKGGGIPQSTPATTTSGGDAWVDRGQLAAAGAVSITSSSLGDKLVAVAIGNPGNIYRSCDYGASWSGVEPSLGVNQWESVASDSTSTNLIASVFFGNIWRSTNSGVTWLELPEFAGGIREWISVASNHDGTILVACILNGNIWRSSDSGTNWTEDVSVGSIQRWSSITCQTVGPLDPTKTKFAATAPPTPTGGPPGGIWTSIDGGATWVISTTAPFKRPWAGITSSASGSNLAAIEKPGDIWLSTNSGGNWTKVGIATSITPPRPNLQWAGIASNSTGSILTAVVNDGNIWKSTDSGATWIEDTTVGTTKDWISVASNAEGNRLAASVNRGSIWTWPILTTIPAFSCAPSPPYPMACIKPPRNTF